MIWTLFGMSFMYLLFIVPIVVCNVFNIEGNHYLICYTLYWFQVYIYTGWLIINMYFSFQYSFNFVVYAACCDQYRAAYLRYLNEKLPFLFGIHTSRHHNTIFFINYSVTPSIRRTVSNPHLYSMDIGKTNTIDVRIDVSL